MQSVRALIAVFVLLTSCSLTKRLDEARHTHPADGDVGGDIDEMDLDAGDPRDADADVADPDDVPEDRDLGADTDGPADITDDAAMCDDNDLGACPEGPEGGNTEVVGCPDGLCVYDCVDGFLDHDLDGACECDEDDATECMEGEADGVCRDSSTCDDSGTCDARRYWNHAVAQGSFYDNDDEVETSCDDKDNDCDGEMDEDCCRGERPFFKAVSSPAAVEDNSVQLQPSVTADDSRGLVAWVEAMPLEPDGQVRFTYLSPWGVPVDDEPLRIGSSPSRLPVVSISGRSDRFLLSLVDGDTGNIVQWEIHDEKIRYDGILFSGNPEAAGVRSLDQAHFGIVVGGVPPPVSGRVGCRGVRRGPM
jgi:hypothetical protein